MLADSPIEFKRSGGPLKQSATFRIVPIAVALGVGVSCSQAEQGTTPALLAARLDSLEHRVDSLTFVLRFREFEEGWEREAFLTPGTDGYAIVRTDLGVLTVSLEDVTAYANGSRILLRFGNTTGATLTGATATIEWGKMDSLGLAIAAGSRSRDVTIAETLTAGAWTNARIVLEGVPPAELGFVRVKNFVNKGIRLRSPYG